MADTATAPMVFNTQYVKDLSFENPSAPQIYGAMAQNQPKLEISVKVTPTQLQDHIFEVVLALRADATVEETPAFVVEVEYAGIVTLAPELDEAGRRQQLMVEAPRYLFPYARVVVSNATRDGGFPPLLVSHIDFAEMQQREQPNGEAEAPRGRRRNSPENGPEKWPGSIRQTGLTKQVPIVLLLSRVLEG